MLKKASLNIVKYFLLGIFLGFFVSITFFKHVHVINGISIVHSHPFRAEKSGNATHAHTASGYLLINVLMNFIGMALKTGSWAFLLSFLFKRIILSKYCNPVSRYAEVLTMRGPPVYSLI